MENEIVALDLFAGTGWGVACQRLGIEERAVELMPEAVATRTANGMETTYRDVWDGILLSREMHQLLYGVYTLLIGSPPCQTFSMAGSGTGRAALNEVLEAIRLHAYKDPQALLEFGRKHDPRTALVLTPLAYVYRDRPQYVALEQVPTVLPVWQACAEVMREMGYSVETAVLNSEQYGVPQTRKRAILVARLDGPVSLPTPSHSRYYNRDQDRLDPGVLKWVSMAEALGWGTEREYAYFKANQLKHAAVRSVEYPAPAITAGHSTGERGFIPGPVGDARVDGRILTVEEAAILQTYPVFRNGNQAHAARRTVDQPAPTIHFGQRSNKVEWMDPALAPDPAASGQRVTVEEAAILQTYPAVPSFVWCGVKSKQYLQIGNAVPPLLAQRVLEALTQEQLI